MKILRIFLVLSIISIFECVKEEKISGLLIFSSQILETSNSPNSNYTNGTSSKNSVNKTWIELELDTPYRITKIGLKLKNDNSSNYLLGIFEGANDPSFFDAIPLYMITKEISLEKMNYFSIDVNYSFKYLRFIYPYNKTLEIINLDFYGFPDIESPDLEEEKLYQPTSLPLVVIHTEDLIDPLYKENSTNFYMLIIDNGKKNIIGNGKIKVRGNDTKNLVKKPYRIKFIKKQNILGLPAKAKKWTLLANYKDKTLIRNSLAFKISSLYEMKYTPSCRFVDLMLNGDFKGNYYLCDQIEVGKNRIEITEMDSSCIEEPEITGGYLLEVDGYALKNKQHARTTRGIYYSIKYPKKENSTPEQLKYIRLKFNSIEKDAYNAIVTNIDTESFIKYIIIQEISANKDISWSTYIIKEREDEKFYFGPVWDFDNAFGNDVRLEPLSEKNNFIFKYSSSAGTMRTFITKLFNNEELLQKLKDGWIEIRNPQLTMETLIDYVDEQVLLINESQILNFMRWDVITRENSTYEKQIDKLKQFLVDRFQQLDRIINNSTIDSINEVIKIKETDKEEKKDVKNN